MTHSVTLAQNIYLIQLETRNWNFLLIFTLLQSQFLQMLIPVWCILWTFGERWSTKKGAKFTQWVNSSIQANIHRKPFAIFTAFIHEREAKSHLWLILQNPGLQRSSFIFSPANEEYGDKSWGGLREFQWIKKRQFVPDSSIPSASYLEHFVFSALTHSPLCLQAGEAASPPRRDGRWRDTQQERGGVKIKPWTLKACLSSLNSSQNKAGKVDKAAKRRKLVGGSGEGFFFWFLQRPSTLLPQTLG